MYQIIDEFPDLLILEGSNHPLLIVYLLLNSPDITMGVGLQLELEFQLGKFRDVLLEFKINGQSYLLHKMAKRIGGFQVDVDYGEILRLRDNDAVLVYDVKRFKSAPLPLRILDGRDHVVDLLGQLCGINHRVRMNEIIECIKGGNWMGSQLNLRRSPLGIKIKNSKFKMQLDDNILRRCKLVIEELQQDLTRKTIDSQQKQEFIQNILNERNHLLSKNQELQKLLYEYKEANIALRAQLNKTESNQLLEKQIARLQSELRDTAAHLENRQLEVKGLEMKLKEQIDSKQHLDREISIAMDEVMGKIRMLEGELKMKEEENGRLQRELKSRRCQCCEAMTDVKTLANLRRKIDQNLRINTKVCNENTHDSNLYKQNTFKTASTRKSISLLKELSNKKSSGNIVNNVKTKQRPFETKNQTTITPFMLNQRSYTLTPNREDPIHPKKNYSVNQDAVNDTLRQIEEKLQKMSQKLAQNDDSDFSMLSIC